MPVGPTVDGKGCDGEDQPSPLRPDTVSVEVLYTSQFTTSIVVDCRRDGSIEELVQAAIEDIEPGTGEYVDDSWEVNSHEVVTDGTFAVFVPPLGEPYQLPKGRSTSTSQSRRGEWFYRTRHSTWVLRVTDDNRFTPDEAAKIPVWVLDSTHEEKDAPRH